MAGGPAPRGAVREVEAQRRHVRGGQRADQFALVESVDMHFGSCDILVNNAGITRDNLAVRITDADWDAVLAVDLSAAFRICRAALRPMLRRREGRIINISSVAGVTGNAGQANYSAAKAGLIGLTKALCREVGSRGITVNAVAPGFIATEMTAALGPRPSSPAPHRPRRRGGGRRALPCSS